MTQAALSTGSKRNVTLRAGRPRGFTLVEMIVVLSMVSFVLGAIGILLHSVWRTEMATRDHTAKSASIAVVAAQFRRDAHAGSLVDDLSVPNDGVAERLALALPGERTVEYEAAPAGITRVERQGASETHRETYRLPRGATAGWRAGMMNERPAVSLLITRPLGVKQPEFAERRTLRVDGLLGWQEQVASREP